MRIQTQAALSIKTSDGRIGFGTTQWLEGDYLLFSSDLELDRGDECEIRMELSGMHASFYGTLRITRVAEQRNTRLTIAVGRMIQIADRDRERLEFWLAERSSGGTSQDPNAWASTSYGASHSSFQRSRGVASRSAASRRPASRSAASSQAAASNAQSRAAVRDALKAGLRQSQRVRAQRAASRQVTMDPAGRQITVQWTDADAMRNDWEDQISRGYLRLALPVAPQTRVRLRLLLPDGQIVALPATTTPDGQKTRINFRLMPVLRQKLRRAATQLRQSA